MNMLEGNKNLTEHAIQNENKLIEKKFRLI